MLVLSIVCFFESRFLLAANRSDVVGSSMGGAESSSAGGTLSEDAASIYARDVFRICFEGYCQSRVEGRGKESSLKLAPKVIIEEER